MSQGLEFVLSADNRNGVVLDSPHHMKEARVLSNRTTIWVLQILNSQLNDNPNRSWWSLGALRQLTYYDSISLKKALQSLSNLGIIDLIKMKKVPRYTVSKKTVHGLIPLDKSTLKRKKIVGDELVCRLKTDFIDIEFNQINDRTLFVSAEDIHLQNLKIFKFLFKFRTMILLQIIGNNYGPMSGNDITDYLNTHHNHASDNEKVIRYHLEDLYKLVKMPFIDDFSKAISSNQLKLKDNLTVVNKDTVRKVGKSVSLLYELNFDRIRLYFTNKQGMYLQNKGIEIEIHYPQIEEIKSTTKETLENIRNQGIIIDVI